MISRGEILMKIGSLWLRPDCVDLFQDHSTWDSRFCAANEHPSLGSSYVPGFLRSKWVVLTVKEGRELEFRQLDNCKPSSEQQRKLVGKSVQVASSQLLSYILPIIFLEM